MPPVSNSGSVTRPLIAVFDDDVAPRALAPDAVWHNPGEVPDNRVDDDGNGVVDDVNGAVFARPVIRRELALGDVATAQGSYSVHGTGVAGIVASHGARVIGVGFTTVEDPLHGFERAVDYVVALRARGQPVRVVNASFGLVESNAAARTRWLQAVHKLEAAGVMLVCALPNESFATSRNEVPSGLDVANIIRVGMRDPTGAVTPGADVVAPGLEIPTTNIHGLRARMNGTSAAAPQVSAAIAQWLERNPGATCAQARDALLSTLNGVDLDVDRFMATSP